MKKLKIILITVLSIFTTMYLAFLFVLPYTIDLNKYVPEIAKSVKEAIGFQVAVKGIALKTSWNLSAGALINRTDLKDPTGKKFAQINDLEFKVALLPLMLRQIKIDNIDADKIILNLEVEKNGKFLLEKYLPKSEPNKKQAAAPLPFGLKFSNSMPKISIKNYKVNFIDISSGKDYSIKGSNFKISDFILNKKIKVQAIGDLILNKRKQISYNVSVFSKILSNAEKQPAQTPAQQINVIRIFEDLYKYNLSLNINTDLKISGNRGMPIIDGKLFLDNFSLHLIGKTLPKSYLKLNFNGDKVKINSDFYTALNENALITGVFSNGNKKSIDLNVSSKKADIGNMFLMMNTLLELAGRNDLKGVIANGDLSANFNVKSDFKNIQSNGFLKIKNANIFHKPLKVALKNIFADVDFSDNKINIKKSTAMLDGKLLSINGYVDSNANADISVFADNLQLKGLLVTLGQVQTLKENDLTSGLISIKASINGRLDKITPTIDMVVSNVNLRNKPNKVQIKLAKAKISAKSDGKKTNGTILVGDLKIFPQVLAKVVSIPNMNLGFNEKDLNINNSVLLLNNSKVNISGRITDYATKKINANITANGSILASDIKSILPKPNQVGVVASGSIPLLIKISGGGDKQFIHAQALASKTNYISVLDIDSLKGKTSLINAEMFLAGNEFQIGEIVLYSLNQNRMLSQNMKSNYESGEDVIKVAGKISNINTANPILRGITVNIPNQITTSIPGYSGSILKVNGNLTLDGTVKNPKINGDLFVPIVAIPTIKTNLKNSNVNFNKNHINASCPNVTIGNSSMGFNSNISSDFSKGILVENLDFMGSYIDLDSLGAAFASLPQSSYAPGVDLGVKILKGKGTVNKFKTGGIVATNITSDLSLDKNILKLENVKANAFGGNVAGGITYNLIYSNLGINMHGRGLSSGPAIKGLTGMPESLTGLLDFDSNVTMRGYTEEQILSTLKGDTKFIIVNGQMGKLGKLEHLLYAQNILSNNVFKATLNVVAKAISVKNTGLYKYIKGDITFANGWANIKAIKTSGPSMSMYITGQYNLLNNSANMVILGRLSGDIVNVLGPIGDLSVDKIVSYIPKLGNISSFLITQFTTKPELENTSMIPYLTPKTELPTKEFKVVINGDVSNQSSVKSFKWLSKPQLEQTTSSTPQVNVPQSVQYVKKQVQDNAKQVLQQFIPQTESGQTSTSGGYVPSKKIIVPIADFINTLPDLK